MDKQVEELVEWVVRWVEEECPCIGCESTGGEPLECEDGASSCFTLRQDIYKLLSHPDLALIDRDRQAENLILSPEHRRKLVDELQPGQPAVESLLRAQIIQLLQAGWKPTITLSEALKEIPE